MDGKKRWILVVLCFLIGLIPLAMKAHQRSFFNVDLVQLDPHSEPIGRAVPMGAADNLCK